MHILTEKTSPRLNCNFQDPITGKERVFSFSQLFFELATDTDNLFQDVSNKLNSNESNVLRHVGKTLSVINNWTALPQHDCDKQ